MRSSAVSAPSTGASFWRPSMRNRAGAVVVVQEHRDGGLAWTFHAAGSKQMNNLRRGHLLYRRPEKAARGK